MGFIEAYRSLFDQIHKSGRVGAGTNQLSVLDVGIGTGGLVQAFLDHATRPVDLTGVDISTEMLTQAEAHLAGRVRSIKLLQQDIQRLRLKDNQFDLVMGAHVLEHLSDPTEGMREMVRVAKPGGSILLVMTRRSLASVWLHLIWQIQTVTNQDIIGMFNEFGLRDVEIIRFAHPVWCNWMSIAIIGRKP